MTDWTQRADDAANLVANTDQQIAELKVKHERDKRKAKRIWSALFLRFEGNIESRKAQAEIHPDYQTAQAAEMTSLLEYEKLRTRRDTADLVIRFWQSWNKAHADGEVL